MALIGCILMFLATFILLIALNMVIIGGIAVIKWELVELLGVDLEKAIYDFKMKMEILKVKRERKK